MNVYHIVYMYINVCTSWPTKTPNESPPPSPHMMMMMIMMNPYNTRIVRTNVRVCAYKYLIHLELCAICARSSGLTLLSAADTRAIIIIIYTPVPTAARTLYIYIPRNVYEGYCNNNIMIITICDPRRFFGNRVMK